MGLDQVIERRVSARNLGFGAEIPSKNEKRLGEILAQVQPEDLLSFDDPGVHRPPPDARHLA
ncbi:MAG: hypothetical protein R3A52_20555 [Polyangiales bacterium]